MEEKGGREVNGRGVEGVSYRWGGKKKKEEVEKEGRYGWGSGGVI